jgi:hypothetical protein
LEYQDVLQNGKNLAGEIYLVDILEKMHLLPSDEKKEIHQFLRQTKQNLLIKSDLESYPEQEDIIKNLFNIICAVLNL